MCLIFMRFGTKNKLNMLIKNIVLEIDGLDPNLKIWAFLVPKLMAPIFTKFSI